MQLPGRIKLHAPSNKKVVSDGNSNKKSRFREDGKCGHEFFCRGEKVKLQLAIAMHSKCQAAERQIHASPLGNL